MNANFLNDQLIAFQHRPGLTRTIVFANSLGSDQTIWNEVIEKLPGGYGIVTFDLRGHGQSSVSKDSFCIDDLANDAIALIENLELQQVIFCGVSVGGMIGQVVASRRPDLVSGAIFCNTSHKIGDKTKWNERIAAVQAGGVEAISEAAMSIWFGENFRRVNPNKVLAHENMLCRTSTGGYIQVCEAIRDAELKNLCGNINLPVLCVGGDEDKSVTPHEVEKLAEIIPNSTSQILNGVGHLPPLDAPEKLALLIQEFEQSIGYESNVGMSTRRSVLGNHHVDKAESSKSDFDAAFQSLITKSAWETVWSSPMISARERSMLTLALLAANGNFEEIPMHIRATVNTGATEQDIAEVFQHVAIYSGVPKANHALKLAKATLAEMKLLKDE